MNVLGYNEFTDTSLLDRVPLMGKITAPYLGITPKAADKVATGLYS